MSLVVWRQRLKCFGNLPYREFSKFCMKFWVEQFILSIITNMPDYVSSSMRGVGAQGDPCTATIIWSIVHLHVLYSASSSILLTEYIVLQNEISS
jgi:hypothetical protein